MRLKNLVCAVVMTAGLFAQYETGGVPTDGLLLHLKYKGRDVVDLSSVKNQVFASEVYAIGNSQGRKDRFGGNSAMDMWRMRSPFIQVSQDAKSPLNTLQSITISAWILIMDPDFANMKTPVLMYKGTPRTGMKSGWCVTIGKGGVINWELGLGVNERWEDCSPKKVSIEKPRMTSSDKYEPAQWTHLVLTFDHASGSQSVYMNGEQVANRVITNLPIAPNNDFLFIGTKDLGYYQEQKSKEKTFTGGLDDVRIYNRAINEKEVKALYKENGY